MKRKEYTISGHMRKGCYLLVIENDVPREIGIGALGKIAFPAGYYVYVGSAMGGLDQRIARHRRREKKLRWHIDYLLAETIIIDVRHIVTDKKIECRLAKNLTPRLDTVSRFGCSDCRCGSHLFYHERLDEVEKAIAETLDICDDTEV